ncbi:TPA: phage major capsid protein [Streptococcus suis]
MTIKLTEVPQYMAAMNHLASRLSEGADLEEQKQLFADAFGALGKELEEMSQEQLKNLFEERAQNDSLSASEIQFFNEVTQKVKDNPGVKTEKIIPEEIMIRVFEDLKVEHPLLSVINFKNTGIQAKALIADTQGIAVWGEIYGDIKGQLTQSFDEITFGMNKLTAFVVLPKDALKFSYKWLKQFIIEQIKEAMAVALELALVKGDGFNQPVGLIKDIAAGKEVVKEKKITFPTDKEAKGDFSTITPENAVATIAPIMKFLSVEERKDGKKKYHKIDGKVRLLVNPADRWELEAKFTKLTDGGAYVLTLPYGIKIIESLAIETGKGILFVADRYDAFMTSSAEIEEYNQVFALEDWMLYTTKAYYFGKAKDNHATAVVTLAGG